MLSVILRRFFLCFLRYCITCSIEGGLLYIRLSHRSGRIGLTLRAEHLCDRDNYGVSGYFG